MIYELRFGEDFIKCAKKLDKSAYKTLRDFIGENLSHCDALYTSCHCKPLKYGLKGYFRYRYKKYRILVKITETPAVIYVLFVDERKEFYQKVKRLVPFKVPHC